MTSDLQNPDRGIKVVAPHIDLIEYAGPSVGSFAVFPLGGGMPLAGFGNGVIARLSLEGELETLASLSGVPLAGVADVDGRSVLIGCDDGRLLSVDNRGDETVIASFGEKLWVDRLSIHAETRRRACAFGKTIAVFDGDGRELNRFQDHDSTVTGLAFSKDGTQIACAHYEAVSVHAIDDGGAKPQRLGWHGSHTQVTWSPDGAFIVSAMQENEMHCWRMPEGKGMRMSGYPSKIRALSWTADSKFLAASGADTVTSWSFSGKGPAGKAPAEFGYVFNEVVTCVSAHPVRHDIAGGYSDGTVIIGSIEQETASIARPGKGSRIIGLNWSPDGNALVAITENGEVGHCQIDLSAMV